MLGHLLPFLAIFALLSAGSARAQQPPPPAQPAVGHAFYNAPYYNTPFYNAPAASPVDVFEWAYNTPFYNSPFDYDDASGPYFGPIGSWSMVPQQTFTTRFSDGIDNTKIKFNDGYGVGFRAGDQFGPWRFEAEFNYRNNDMRPPSGPTTPQQFDGGTHVYSLLGNAIYDFRTPFLGPVTPHIGGGVGVANADTWAKFGAFTQLDSGDTQFAYQALAGLRFPLTPNVALDLDYRRFGTSGFKLKDPFGDPVTQSYTNNSLMVSVTWKFGYPTMTIGGPLPPPPPPPPAH